MNSNRLIVEVGKVSANQVGSALIMSNLIREVFVLVILIDGYNVIRRNQPFGEVVRDNDLGRGHFLRQVFDYCQTRECQVIVVFDGTYSDNRQVEEYNKENLKVLFSAFGQTADELIVSLATKYTGCVVVTSDTGIIQSVKRLGCGTLSSDDFLLRMNSDVSFKDDVYDKRDADYVSRRISTDKKGPRKKKPKSERKAISKLSKF